MSTELQVYLDALAASGKQDSSGRFTWDLRRMVEVLARFQLSHPEEFPYRLIAAAVLGGARTWKMSESRGGQEFTWDGQPFTFEELRNVLPSLAPGPSAQPRLREMAAAVGGARNLGDLVFESAGGRLTMANGYLVLEPHSLPGQNRFVLKRKGLKAWLPGRSSSLERAAWAPLTLEPKVSVAPAKERMALQVGRPPVAVVQADKLIELPEDPRWGCGAVWPGPGLGRIVFRGISYPVPLKIPGFDLIWWTDAIPLDVSFGGVVQGEEFQAWQEALLNRMIEGFLPRGLHSDWLMQEAVERQSAAFLEAPLFRRGSGQRVSFATLRAEYRRHGFLPTLSRPGLPAWEPERCVVVELPREDILKTYFHCRLDLDSLLGKPPLARLPEPDGYLLRFPHPAGGGEAGLVRRPRLQGRRWQAGQWSACPRLLAGLDVTMAEGGEDSGSLCFDFYNCLRNLEPEARDEDAYLFQVLSLFDHLARAYEADWGDSFERRGRLRVLLDPTRKVQIPGTTRNLSNSNLIGLVRKARVAVRGQSSRSLAELLEADARWTVAVDSRIAAPGCLVVAPAALALVRRLLNLTPIEPAASLLPATTRVTGQALEGGLAALLALFDRPETSAHQLLQQCGRLEPVRAALQARPLGEEEWGSVLGEAVGLCGGRHGGCLASEHLLQAWLRHFAEDLGQEEVARAVPGFALVELGRECLAGLGRLCLPAETSAYSVRMLESLARLGKLEEARRRISGYTLLEGDRLSVLALLAELEGNLPDSLLFSERLLSLRDRPSARRQPVDGSPTQGGSMRGVFPPLQHAARLVAARRFEEAGALLDGLEPDGWWLALRARMSEDPRETVSLCEQARSRESWPASVWETEGEASEALGRPEAAAECYREFAAVPPEAILEARIRERQGKALIRSRECATDSQRPLP